MVRPLRYGRKLWREEELSATVVERSHLRSGCLLLVVFSHQTQLLILSNTVGGNMTGLVYKLPVHKKKKPAVLLVRICSSIEYLWTGVELTSYQLKTVFTADVVFIHRI